MAITTAILSSSTAALAATATAALLSFHTNSLSSHRRSPPRILHLSPLPPPPPLSLVHRRTPPPLIAAASFRSPLDASPPPVDPTENKSLSSSPFSDSIATILSLSRLFLKTLMSIAYRIACPTPDEAAAAMRTLGPTLLLSAGPLFFANASAADYSGGLGKADAPVRILAKGLARWLDLYRNLLMIRIMLSWFPNIPWDKQPLCAIRDICDPYLNLFRPVVPLVFDMIDVSPFLAFAIMGAVSAILKGQ